MKPKLNMTKNSKVLFGTVAILLVVSVTYMYVIDPFNSRRILAKSEVENLEYSIESLRAQDPDITSLQDQLSNLQKTRDEQLAAEAEKGGLVTSTSGLDTSSANLLTAFGGLSEELGLRMNRFELQSEGPDSDTYNVSLYGQYQDISVFFQSMQKFNLNQKVQSFFMQKVMVDEKTGVPIATQPVVPGTETDTSAETIPNSGTETPATDGTQAPAPAGTSSPDVTQPSTPTEPAQGTTDPGNVENVQPTDNTGSGESQATQGEVSVPTENADNGNANSETNENKQPELNLSDNLGTDPATTDVVTPINEEQVLQGPNVASGNGYTWSFGEVTEITSDTPLFDSITGDFFEKSNKTKVQISFIITIPKQSNDNTFKVNTNTNFTPSDPFIQARDFVLGGRFGVKYDYIGNKTSSFSTSDMEKLRTNAILREKEITRARAVIDNRKNAGLNIDAQLNYLQLLLQMGTVDYNVKVR